MSLLRESVNITKCSRSGDTSIIRTFRCIGRVVLGEAVNHPNSVNIDQTRSGFNLEFGLTRGQGLSERRQYSTRTSLLKSNYSIDTLSSGFLGVNTSTSCNTSSALFMLSQLSAFHSCRFSKGMSVIPNGNAAIVSENGTASFSTKSSSITRDLDANIMGPLCSKIEELLEVKLAQIAELRTKFGQTKIGEITISQVLGGMRDMVGMNCETSHLDANTGITYRGLTIPQILEHLPGLTPGNNCPYTESVLWLLLTGQVPTEEEALMLSKELARRARLPHYVYKVIDKLPIYSHPMTQYVAAITALQTESVFRKAYSEKTYRKDTAWKVVLEDALNLIAQNPLIVGYIYRRTFVDNMITDGQGMIYDPDMDYAANVAKLIGIDTPEFHDMMRLYIAVHADHEGGNVSAHSALLIGSALSDPYFCFAGALTGLSGPLHGLANQECLSWINKLVEELKGNITLETVTKFAQDTLKKGQVIPGYGHAVLRVEDPRHTAFVNFAHKHFPDDPLVKVLDICLKAIPPVLQATGKVKSPHPNVDCSTGILLSHFGISHPDMFTVFFGISRAIGIMSQLVWSRALRMPIERPKSHTVEKLLEMCKEV